MAKNRLNIIQTTLSSEPPFEKRTSFSQKGRIKEMEAKFERLWLTNPEQFDPMRNCMERERLERTWQLLTKHVKLKKKQATDIGCGSGVFSRRMRDEGAIVEGVDIAANALKRFKEADAREIILKQDAMPETGLPDHACDVIVCTELIAELSKDDYRLFFAELSRLIKEEGRLICSSAIDIQSTGGSEKLVELAQTEFEILEDVASYHALYIRLVSFFEAPARFLNGWKDHDTKQKELLERRDLNRWWFWLNTTPFLVWIWMLCNPPAQAVRKFLKQSPRILLNLEKLCRLIWDKDGISHYLFIAKKRVLKSIDPADIPIEKPRRKEIWD